MGKKSLFQKYARQMVELGFGQSYAEGNKRLVNKDGTFNIVKENTIRHFYVDLIGMSWKKFFFYVILFYVTINIVFGTIYFFLGPQYIHVNPSHDRFYQYFECINFSVQTMATVGYGNLHPDSFWAQAISSIEALMGILIFAIMTGLSYSRFSKPTAGYKFSDHALIAPYKEINSLQMRVANNRSNNLVEIEASLLVSMNVDDHGKNRRVFLTLPLEMNKIYYLALTWTIVHPIDEDSPLYGKTIEDLIDAHAEFMLMVKSYDDAYAQVVHGNTSYLPEEIIWGARFTPSYNTGPNGVAIFKLDKIDEHEPAELNGIYANMNSNMETEKN